VPFALWNRTNFLAERVLGNVVTSGIKVMVLAVIVGIGSTYFSQFTAALQGKEPDIGQAMSLVLASLALLGLGIFGPTIASGLVAGAPQLGAGSVAATGALVAGGAAAVASGGAAAAGAIGGASLGAIRAGASMGPAAFKAYRGGQADAGASTVSAGLAGVYNAARSKMAEGAAKSGEGRRAPRREASRAGHSRAKGSSGKSATRTPATVKPKPRLGPANFKPNRCPSSPADDHPHRAVGRPGRCWRQSRHR
jgi:type IV secretion system protein TrbL